MAEADALQTREKATNRPLDGRTDPREEARFQEHLLLGVSRTFALTIPQLPNGLREAVSNAYLLCRIADTIEDDPDLDAETKDSFHEAFVDTAASGCGAEDFAQSVWPLLSTDTLEAEIELIRESPRVLERTRQLAPHQRMAILQCLTTMGRGMSQFERSRSRRGLSGVAELERYCYFVAGVVGEMLTELFCYHSLQIKDRRNELEARAVSFGLGLQMTNILKDIWDDYENGVCWLPREIFDSYGYDLSELHPHHNGNGPAFAKSMQHLVRIAHDHLRNALEYTLTIPRNETGIRRFLIWATLLAASTLRKISNQPLFTEGTEVKVSRRSVAGIVGLSNAFIRSNTGLAGLFNIAGRGLPLHDGNGSSKIVERESKTQ